MTAVPEREIGGVRVAGPVTLAPLAGLTDLPFRQLCKGYGAAMLTTEMASSEGISRGHEPSLEYARFDPTERPIAVQICGSDARVMAEAARIVVDEVGPEFVDANFGCPVRKIVGKGAGSACLREPERLGDILSEMASAVDVPITAKIRAGWDRPVADSIAVVAEEAGASAVTIHGRTREQGYTGAADWGVVRRAVDKTDRIAIVGNGDVTDAATARARFEQTGCDLLMIGRGAVGQPWVFRQILHELRTGERLPEPLPSERLRVIALHYRLALRYRGKERAVGKMRSHLKAYLERIPHTDDLVRELFAERDAMAVLARIESEAHALRASEDRAGLEPTLLGRMPTLAKLSPKKV